MAETDDDANDFVGDAAQHLEFVSRRDCETECFRALLVVNAKLMSIGGCSRGEIWRRAKRLLSRDVNLI